MMVGCGSDSDGPASVTVADSAGVEIVTSHAPQWAEGTGWRVDSNPSVSIGAFGGEPEYELFNVSDAVRFDDGTIGVVNSGTQEVRFYDTAGGYLRAIGRDGEGPGEFRRPSAAYPLAGDSLAVWDSRMRRVSLFDSAGTFVRSFVLGTGGQLFSASVLSDRTLLGVTRIAFGRDAPVGARRDSSVYVLFDLDGDSLLSLGRFPTVDRFIRATETGMTVSTMIFGRTSYRAAYGTSWFVANNDAYVIDELDRAGRLVRSIRRDVAPVEATGEMVDREINVRLNNTDAQVRKVLAEFYAEMPKPSVLPAYGGLEVDPDGNLWVRHYSTAADPVYKWTVFDSAGRMLGDVEFPTGLTVYEIGDDYVLGRWRDEMDIDFVRLHSLTRR
jgi:hypothetical protein